MIRETTPGDAPAIVALVVATGIFAAEDAPFLEEMMSGHFADADTTAFLLSDTDDAGEPIGVAYCVPEQLAASVWNLLLIAVHPEAQGRKRGAALLREVENRLVAQGGRMLLVETSGTETFERTRTFYRKNGYEQEARIRDYYNTGDDKMVFRKVLSAPGKATA